MIFEIKIKMNIVIHCLTPWFESTLAHDVCHAVSEHTAVAKDDEKVEEKARRRAEHGEEREPAGEHRLKAERE